MTPYRYCLLVKNRDNDKSSFFCSKECLPVEKIDKLCDEKKNDLFKENNRIMVYSTLYPCSNYLPEFLDILRANYNSSKFMKRFDKNLSS